MNICIVYAYIHSYIVYNVYAYTQNDINVNQLIYMFGVCVHTYIHMCTRARALSFYIIRDGHPSCAIDLNDLILN